MQNKTSLSIFLLLIIFCLFIFQFIDSFIGIYLTYTACIVYCMANIRGNALDPSSWLVAFYAAYTLPYPIFLIVSSTVDVYAYQMIYANFFGLLGIIFSITLFGKSYSNKVGRSAVDDKALNIILSVICLVLLVGLWGAYGIGHSSKREFLDATNKGGAVSLLILFLPYSFLFAMKLIRNFAFRRISIQKIDCLFLIPFVLAFLLIGERDVIFRIILFVFLLIFTFKYKYKEYYLYALLFVAVIILPVTQEAKALLVSDSIISTDLDWNKILFGEFSASSRNLHFLIKYHPELLLGESYLWDIKRVLSFVFPESYSTGFWFNEEFRIGQGFYGTSGWGFSLIGLGHLNFGMAGIFVQFFVITSIICWFNKVSMKSDLHLSFYLMNISALIYCQRADLANLINLGIKIPLLTIIVLVVFNQIYLFITKPYLFNKDN